MASSPDDAPNAPPFQCAWGVGLLISEGKSLVFVHKRLRGVNSSGYRWERVE